MQLITESGYCGLRSGEVYYFLSNDQKIARVSLVIFSLGKTPSPILITMSAQEFESGLLSGRIVSAKQQWSLPPWLRECEGVNFNQLEMLRKSSVVSYVDRVTQRYMYISGAIAELGGRLSDQNLNSLLNAYARALRPSQSSRRIRLWFYTYLLFGRNVWSLMPTFHNIGQWDRSRISSIKKLGRTSLSGDKGGYGVTLEMAEAIANGYAVCSSSTSRMEDVYEAVLTRKFGCIAIKGADSEIKFIQPESKPFPSISQFKYWVRKSFAPKSLQEHRYGSERVRIKLSPDVGKFSEGLSNLLQRVELDAYYCKARPAGLIEGGVMDALCVVRALCSVSGYVVGVGFSYNKEDLSGYLMALFSMAVGKSEFCRLFGLLSIDDSDWRSVGLSTNIILDRGPGSNNALLKICKWIDVRELPPSYSGQSKAAVESSHPRSTKTDGRPRFFKSKHNTVEMAKRELIRVMKDNHKSDASERLTPEMINFGVKPTPDGIYKFLDARARTNAFNMSFQDAVREFLKPIKVTLKQDAVYFNRRRFNSKELQLSGVFEKIKKGQSVEVEAYVLEMCVRHIWIDIAGQLFELDALLSIRDHEGQLYVTLADLNLELDALKVSQSSFRESKPAISAYYDQMFVEATGKKIKADMIQSGKPSKGKQYRRELDDFARNMKGGS